MFQKTLSVSGGGTINTITGKAQQTLSFTAVIGHRYVVAFSNLNEGTGISNPIDGLDVIDSSGKLSTSPYQGYYSLLQMVIGRATKTTVSCSWQPVTTGGASLSNITWIDLDA